MTRSASALQRDRALGGPAGGPAARARRQEIRERALSVLQETRPAPLSSRTAEQPEQPNSRSTLRVDASRRRQAGLRPTGRTPSSPWGPDKRQRTISLTDTAWNRLEDLGAPHGMAASEVLEIVIRFAAAKSPDLLRLRTSYLPK